MSRVTSIFTPKPIVVKAKSVNRDGYPSFTMPIEEQTLQTLLCNTFGHTFYADQRDLVKESEAVFEQMLNKDARFFANALVFARNEGYMRSQPVFGLAMLSEYDAGMFKAAFNHVILTPKDLSDFMAVVEARHGGSQGGRAIKTAVANWLSLHFGKDSTSGEYWAVKYGSSNKSGYSLKDLIITTHPSGVRADIAKWLLGKKFKLTEKTSPKLYWYEKLKVASTVAEKVEAIENGKLPHEVASTFAGDSKGVWSAIFPNLPPFALLRNINNLDHKGILDGFKREIQTKLSDPVKIKNSKILPFRFYEAYKVINKEWAKNLMAEAIDASFENIPDFVGKTAVVLDVSGSMSSFLDTASLFAVCAARKGGVNKITLFDTRAWGKNINPSKSILTEAQSISTGGGTDIAAPIRFLTNQGEVYDNIILITDEQQNSGSPMYNEFERYRKALNMDVNLFVVDVSPYRAALTPPKGNVHYIFGWSDQVMNYISATTRGWSSQVQKVKAMDADLDFKVWTPPVAQRKAAKVSVSKPKAKAKVVKTKKVVGKKRNLKAELAAILRK